ncbi:MULTISPECIES: glycosyltransferase family 4 protein [unclassified Isoptericola]|uniref:glycosyltransferase family 4 protein n=1 Tax=unclassified Isoptericola TaxID=2623355 RepID=UPI002713D724|nr:MULTISPECIES: MraY family glycosyltransferase [unclassified Isoptericola]MDO8143031.1 MraY family glycosyltransferase [Isoptericola sp. 178]MDO8146892.1 MraY family glycosyltransferase [Isoptericola sp. b515]MDO8150793.1 MraY family glycosyltransferase [Isoptericola sp. b408]
MRAYLLVMLIAAAVTYLATPGARWVARRTNAISAVRARDVHVQPTPRLGGLAMLLGIVVAVLLASRMPFLAGVFAEPQVFGVVGGAVIVCLLGWADDIWDLDWMTKLAGQILAAGFLVVNQVQLTALPMPGGLTIPSARLSLFVTILVIVVAMNAVNFVDGLDGLAAGIVAIGGSAFFLYTYFLTQQASPADYSSFATMMTAVLVGVCLGFLPHNFYPSHIFMGDSGSMILGLVFAGAAISITSSFDPTVTDALSGAQRATIFIPLLLPLAVTLLPLLDMTMAVVRRLAAGKSPMAPDRMHLHHRMLALGHSHRRAVLILYVWTAVFAFGTAALVAWRWQVVLAWLVVAVVVALVLTLGPLRTRGRFLDDDVASGANPVAASSTPTPSGEGDRP